jgi:hypothetical protein
MGELSVIPSVDEGLGNSACLVDLADGRAPAVDASRDVAVFGGGRQDWSEATGRPVEVGS